MEVAKYLFNIDAVPAFSYIMHDQTAIIKMSVFHLISCTPISELCVYDDFCLTFLNKRHSCSSSFSR